VFATAWADFVIELFTNHLFHAALGEGQDFVDFVLHFRFPFSFLTSYIDILQTRLEVVNKKKKIFLRFFLAHGLLVQISCQNFGTVFAGIPPLARGRAGQPPPKRGFLTPARG
jgi:hypothetical protein